MVLSIKSQNKNWKVAFMKKYFLPLIFPLLLVLLSSGAYATPEQKATYSSDPRYAVAYTFEDGACFVDLSSIAAEEYNPPRYQISATTYFIADSQPQIAVRFITFRYNYEEQVIYIKSMDGKWYWLNPDENPISMCQIRLADFLFRHCYRMSFIR